MKSYHRDKLWGFALLVGPFVAILFTWPLIKMPASKRLSPDDPNSYARPGKKLHARKS